MRRLPSLAPLAVGSHPVLVTAAPLPARSRRVRVRVRVRACVRAGRDALAQACTPARAHCNPGGEAGPLALLLRRTSSSHNSSPAPPWPRRGGLPRARVRRRGSATLLTGECAFRNQPPFPRAFEPSCGRRVHRHPWRRPKRRRAFCVHSVPGQARVDHPWCVTLRASNPRGALETIVWRPDSAVGSRRRQGRAPPPSHLGAFHRTPWAVLETAGDLCTQGTTRGSDRNRSAQIRCGPPLIS
jgi:hypothetical protein